ncbi:MAG: nitroreductase family deazaflavin-dependent oxidoreductase [Caldilineaceae bacterium]|nr:nitroreductase family deazaflavin-dependent oxidoreductase [Caldilineaceae bacterium]
MNSLQRLIQRIAALRPVTQLLVRVAPRADRVFLRMTNNRYTLTSLVTGLPVIRLTTIGARSGEPRTVLLVVLEDGPKLILIASNFGQARHPAWYYNLQANPRAKVNLRGETGDYVARAATAEERDHYWRTAVSLYAGYAAYKERAANRQIPIFVLEPTGQ